MTLPDKISLTRVPLGALILIFALQGDWGWALITLIVGALTDALDGWVAKTWQLGTKRGAEIIDPVCDLILSLGALGGVLFTGQLSWWFVPLLLVIYIPIQVIVFFYPNTPAFYRFASWAAPGFFLIVLFGLITGYASIALDDVFGPFMNGLGACTTLLIILKRQRIHDWVRPTAVNSPS